MPAARQKSNGAAASRLARSVLTDHRHRLLEGMARACAEHGYSTATIADVAAQAKVSKRTFYEHFDSKTECFIALYESASAQSLSVLKSQVDSGRDWRTQLEMALNAYFQALAVNPLLLRTLFVEILGLGAPGLAARRNANRQIADYILEVAQRDPMPGVGARLTAQDAMGLVGAINELVLDTIERGNAENLPELVGPAARLVRAVVDGVGRPNGSDG